MIAIALENLKYFFFVIVRCSHSILDVSETVFYWAFFFFAQQPNIVTNYCANIKHIRSITFPNRIHFNDIQNEKLVLFRLHCNEMFAFDLLKLIVFDARFKITFSMQTILITMPTNINRIFIRHVTHPRSACTVPSWLPASSRWNWVKLSEKNCNQRSHRMTKWHFVWIQLQSTTFMPMKCQSEPELENTECVMLKRRSNLLNTEHKSERFKFQTPNEQECCRQYISQPRIDDRNKQFLAIDVCCIRNALH